MTVKTKDGRIVKVYENHWMFKVPGISNFDGMTVSSKLVLFKREYQFNILCHELVHTSQMAKEKLLPLYYIKYFCKWLILYFKTKNWMDAYFNIPYEKEAYGHVASKKDFQIVER